MQDNNSNDNGTFGLAVKFIFVSACFGMVMHGFMVWMYAFSHPDAENANALGWPFSFTVIFTATAICSIGYLLAGEEQEWRLRPTTGHWVVMTLLVGAIIGIAQLI